MMMSSISKLHVLYMSFTHLHFFLMPTAGTVMRPPSEHPLHVAHKMTPGKKATDNIYGELGDLEKVNHFFQDEFTV